MKEEEKAKQLLEHVKTMMEQIAMIHQQAYNYYKPQVELLIASKVRDENSIQHLLDHLLDHACNDEVLLLYKKLCRYYWDLNPQATVNYIHYYREMWGDEDESDSKNLNC